MGNASPLRDPSNRKPGPDPGHLVRLLFGTSAGIVALYAGVSTLWFIISDPLLNEFVASRSRFAYASALQNTLFVAASSALLYPLLRFWRSTLDKSVRMTSRLERALEGSAEGWWDWKVDTDEIFYSDRWWSMLGYRVGEQPADSDLWRRMTHPEDLPRADAALAAAFESDTVSVSLEVRLRHKDGHYIPIWVRYRIERNRDGGPAFVSGTCLDLSEIRCTEERLRQAAVVFDTTREGIMVTDADTRILMVNNAFKSITGYSEADVIGKTPAILSSGRQSAEFYASLWARLRLTGYWQGEIWNRRKNGEVYPELLSIGVIKNECGEVINYVGTFADISRVKDSESKLEFLAHYDALTRLPNRRLFYLRLEHILRSMRHERFKLAIIMLDLDRFKDVNDSFGHGAGDELLQLIGKCLTRHLRSSDVVARLSGDEFAIVLERIEKPEDAAHIASELIGKIGGPWSLSNGAEVRVNVSMGISVFPLHAVTASGLLQHADTALNQAKSEGRGCFRYFSENLAAAARERLNLEARLHRALEQGELRVFFQPQIDIASGVVVGAEALIRWQDPREGVIPPARFIPLAETTGLIAEIGEWMLRETCLQGRRWLDQGLPGLVLAVNLSPRQLTHGDIVAVVSKVLAESGYPAELLELELTESALMDREEEVVTVLRHLRDLGVKVALDDFGTGYSSLAYLKKFSLDVLKIDKCFIANVPDSKEDVGIVSAIIAMGRFMGFKVIAEGVETPEQLDFLCRQGCDVYQGYLASKPVPAEEFVKLKEWNSICGQSEKGATGSVSKRITH